MLPYMWASQEKCFGTVAAVMTNADTAFTISGGPIQIISLLSECITANGATASTLQWQSAPTVGSAKTISEAGSRTGEAGTGSTNCFGTADGRRTLPLQCGGRCSIGRNTL